MDSPGTQDPGERLDPRVKMELPERKERMVNKDRLGLQV